MPFQFVVGAVIGAAASSRAIRATVRKGMIYGVGGALIAYDKITAMAHGVAKEARKAAAARSEAGNHEAAGQVPPAATADSHDAAPRAKAPAV